MPANSGPGYARHPEHTVRLEPAAGTVTVILNGQTIAETSHAVAVHEADYPPVHYLPRDSLKGVEIQRTERHTQCPFKGEASYYSLVQGGRRVENAIWSYEAPYDEVEALKDRIAFYPNLVDEIRAG